MYSSKKTYVINPEDLGSPTSHNRGPDTFIGAPTDVPSWMQPSRKKKKASSGAGSGGGLGPGVLIVYLLGPFAPGALGARRGWIWAALGGAALLIWTWTLWGWNDVAAALGNGVMPVGVWGAVMVILALAGITAWARAVLLYGGRPYFDPERSPRWLRDPRSLGVMGFLLPGSGLFLAGHPRRAAAAFWTSGLLAVSVLILLGAGSIWNFNRAAASKGISAGTLETALIAVALTGALAALLWISQALDGARRGAVRLGVDGIRRGDGFALGLLVAGALFFVSFDPPSVARDLDSLVVETHERGFQTVPLYLSRMAARLDPAEPLYVLRTAEIYEEMGERHTARMLRSKLQYQRQHYEHLLEPQNAPALAPGWRSPQDPGFVGPPEPPIL
jgi:hypothetical protein